VEIVFIAQWFAVCEPVEPAANGRDVAH
jgi:hypothetical protein